MNDEQAIEYVKKKLKIKKELNDSLLRGRARRNYKKLKRRRRLPQKYIVVEWEENIDKNKFMELLNIDEVKFK